jgi:hypothetical protein
MGANVKLETVSDVIRNGGNLLVECGCGKRSIVDAVQLDRWFKCHGWATVLSRIGAHLRCSSCRQRPANVRATLQTPTTARWGPKTEDDWRRLVRRLRD